MKITHRILTVAALLVVAGTANAQRTPPDKPSRPALTDAQKQRLEQKKDEIQQHRDQLKQKADQLVAQRKEQMEQLREIQKSIRDQVAAGTLTKDQAREQIRAWREAHKPTPPDGAKPPHRPPPGDVPPQ
jgi:Spy/CpxP family protein refolding chaperone